MANPRNPAVLPTPPAARRRGFTIVELLVVISIIAVLLSLVSVSLLRGGETARQTAALAGLREVGRAWQIYSTQNEDRCLPGYLDDGAQQQFKIRTRDSQGTVIDRQFCRTYPFRLLPFLDNDRAVLYRYLADVPDLGELTNQQVADIPAFGYNAYYVGGWYEQDSSGQVRMKFAGTGYFNDGNLVRGREVVARTPSEIARPSELTIFSSSTRATPGYYAEPNEDVDGSAIVVPSWLADQQVWQSSDGPGAIDALSGDGSAASGAGVVGNNGIYVFTEQSVPLRRIRNVVQTVRADLSTALLGPRELMDQTRWIGVAHLTSDPPAFRHPAAPPP